MKKRWKWWVLALVVLTAAYFLAAETLEITNQDSSNGGVVAFGDSLVEGVGSDGGGFVRFLSEDLHLPIPNLGRSGDTTGLALKRVEEVALMKPAVTIVLLGGNDFLRGVPESETEANLRQIIEALHGAGSAVVLVGIESNLVGDSHGRLFKTLSKEYGTAYVPDILEGIYGYQEFMSDNLHPNEAGYRLMAERIKPVLGPLTR